MKSKICSSFVEAVADIPNGASIIAMSFAGPTGIAQNLVLALRDLGAKDLVFYALPNFGTVGRVTTRPGFKPYIAPAILVENHQVKKAIVSWGRGGADFLNVLEKVLREHQDVDIEFLPFGVFAQKVAAGGAGMGGFYSPIGVGTPYEIGKEKRVINGREYIFEPAIRADFGFIRAYKADTLGNLVYKGAMRGGNPLIAKACNTTIAEVDEIVEAGELSPEEIVTPGIFVDRIVEIPEGGHK